MDDDFNTAGALAAVFELAKAANVFLVRATRSTCARRTRTRCCAAEETVVELLGVLGIEIAEPQHVLRTRPRSSTLARDLAGYTGERSRGGGRGAARRARGRARPRRNWALADAVRDGLTRARLHHRGHAAGRARHLRRLAAVMHRRPKRGRRGAPRGACRSSGSCSPRASKPRPAARRDRAARARGGRAGRARAAGASSTAMSERGAHQGVIAVGGAVSLHAARATCSRRVEGARARARHRARPRHRPRATSARSRAPPRSSARPAVIVPKRRSAAVTPAAWKAAAGALAHVPVVQETNLVRALEQLKEAGFWVAGASEHAEQTVWEAPLEGRHRARDGLGGRRDSRG